MKEKLSVAYLQSCQRSTTTAELLNIFQNPLQLLINELITKNRLLPTFVNPLHLAKLAKSCGLG